MSTAVAIPAPRIGEVHVRRAVPEDEDGLASLLAGLSSASAHQRFLTGLGRRPPRSLVARLLADGEHGSALVAELDGALVGHGHWAHARDRTSSGVPHAAEIAVVVADRHQRQGIGGALIAGLVREISRRGYARLQVVTGTHNRTVLRMVARQRTVAPPRREGPCLTYELAL
jgi:acetyltransferase